MVFLLSWELEPNDFVLFHWISSWCAHILKINQSHLCSCRTSKHASNQTSFHPFMVDDCSTKVHSIRTWHTHKHRNCNTQSRGMQQWTKSRNTHLWSPLLLLLSFFRYFLHTFVLCIRVSFSGHKWIYFFFYFNSFFTHLFT